jgi:tRNA nucleotidyltransferase/poly(A) polymerase
MTKLIKDVDEGRIGNNDDNSVFVAAGKRNIVGIRVAGGWVRDKLLHQHSDDVDVALDCMMGVQFARVVQSYMALSLSTPSSSDEEGEDGDNDHEGVEEERRLKRRPAGRGRRHPKIGVIGANPSQSKHLETATMKIYGIDVDFVNLRANEVYGADSRIPTFGTTLGSWSLEPGLEKAGSGSRIPPAFGAPLEDALRRDFTINSLFYNVRTGKIEDWTGRGLDDLLRRRLVVTPVDPHVTFHDDPLRVLRAIRFAVRLDFALDASIVEAAMSERVHRSLHAKVSRERIGKELEGMLSGKHARPGRALDAIARLHLAGSVFAFPGKFPGDQDQVSGPVTGRILGVEYTCDICTSVSDGASVNFDVNSLIAESAARQRARGWEESRMLLSLLPKLMKGQINEMEKMAMNAVDVLPLTPVDKRLLYLCVFILPFYELTFPDQKGREVTVTSHMVKEAIKFPQRDAQSVSKILSQIDEMATLLSEFRSQMTNTISMQGKRGDATQKLIPPCRMRVGLLLRSLREQWVTCLIAAAAWEIRTYPTQHVGDNKEGIATSLVPVDQPVCALYHVIVDNLGLDRCWHMHPHLNGKEIIQELGLHNGPLVGAYVEDQTRWMLLNPHGTKEECVTHLRERKLVRGVECSCTS